MPASYHCIFLFGDSITQDSYNQERGSGGFSAKLQHEYIRRLDVINRGLSGYNTSDARKVLPFVIPSPDEARIRLLTIFFGANDAALPQAEDNQHVPLETYKANLESIITHPLIKAHKTNIILITPPPINEHLQWLKDQTKGLQSVSRKAAITKRYAQGAAQVGEKLGIPVVNLWNTFMQKAGLPTESWAEGDGLPGAMEVPQNDVLVDLLYDGLHFSPAGYNILFDEVMKVIKDKWPELLPANLPFVLPAWNDARAWEEWTASHVVT